MNLKDLKAMRIGDLTEIAKNLHVDGAAGLKKQELIFAILQAQTDQEVIVSGEGATGSCAPRTPTICRGPTTSTSLPRRSAVSGCAPETR